MGKINLKIIAKRTGQRDAYKTLVNIDIKNGNWYYWDIHQKTSTKVPISINTVCKSFYLSLPVKDQIETEDKSIVRTYDSLLEYLNFRLNYINDNYWRILDTTTVEFEITLFKCGFLNREDITAYIPYLVDEEAIVKIRRCY